MDYFRTRLGLGSTRSTKFCSVLTVFRKIQLILHLRQSILVDRNTFPLKICGFVTPGNSETINKLPRYFNPNTNGEFSTEYFCKKHQRNDRLL